MAKLLGGSESLLGQDRILTVREERALKAMDLEEAKRARAELQKTRSLQSFAQQRAKRQVCYCGRDGYWITVGVKNMQIHRSKLGSVMHAISKRTELESPG